jgi:hypothetical protein
MGLFVHAAFVATILYVVPNGFPLFAPGERPVANDADFLGQVLLLYVLH